MGQGCKSFQPLSVSHDTLATFPGGRQLRPLRRRVGGLALFFVRMLLGCMLLADNCALAYAVHDLDRGGAAGARWRTQFLRSHARAVADHGNTIDAGTPFATRKQAALRSAISDLVAEGALGAARYLPRCALRSVHAARFDAARFRAEHQSPRVPLLATGLWNSMLCVDGRENRCGEKFSKQLMATCPTADSVFYTGPDVIPGPPPAVDFDTGLPLR